MSGRDHTGLAIPGGSIPFSTGMARYEVPFIKQAQAAGRYAGKYTIGQLREMHDLAPSIFFAIEGMVGNQMEPDRGGYAE
ncbi:S-layer protein, partial [Achromobacter xylosoxidans]|nr:S-layer protein [Achromobacter xylosoxidans]